MRSRCLVTGRNIVDNLETDTASDSTQDERVDDGLRRRSSEIRGLGDAEREWIAVSGGDWQAFEYDYSRHREANDDGSDERPWPKPTPVTAVAGIGPDDASVLGEAGIISAERLATIDAATVATVLELDVLHVRTWRYNARDLID